jgi:hypothetical protein
MPNSYLNAPGFFNGNKEEKAKDLVSTFTQSFLSKCGVARINL